MQCEEHAKEEEVEEGFVGNKGPSFAARRPSVLSLCTHASWSLGSECRARQRPKAKGQSDGGREGVSGRTPLGAF